MWLPKCPPRTHTPHTLLPFFPICFPLKLTGPKFRSAVELTHHYLEKLHLSAWSMEEEEEEVQGEEEEKEKKKKEKKRKKKAEPLLPFI